MLVLGREFGLYAERIAAEVWRVCTRNIIGTRVYMQAVARWIHSTIAGKSGDEESSAGELVLRAEEN